MDELEKVKRYRIGGVTYEQRPLVLGQWRQLRSVIEGIEVAEGNQRRSLLAALETHGRLDRALAVVLTPEGQSLPGKDLAALAEQLEYAITPEQIVTVFDDFFFCNPVSSILSQLAAPLGKLVLLLSLLVTGSSRPVSVSPTATSPAATPCSGESPPPDACPG